MREPDRFDEQARELCASHVTYKEIAAALRAAESSALERAAGQIQVLVHATNAMCDVQYRNGALMALEAVRALIPPAAAPAAEGELRRTVHGEEDAVPGEPPEREGK